MGVWDRIRAWMGGERRIALKDPALVDLFAGAKASTAGVSVTPDSAMNLVSVYSCVRIIAETIASLPLQIYRRTDAGRYLARGHYLYQLLHDAPNSEMTSFSFVEALMASLLLRGNAYAEMERDGSGRVVGLWPISPTRVAPKRVDGKLVYEVNLTAGGTVTLTPDRLLHIHGLSSDGMTGYSPIRLAREAVGLAIAAEEYGARFFGNGSRPAGVLTHPGAVSAEAAKRLKAAWEEAHQGLGKAHRVALLEEGMSWTKIGIDPNDAQFLETRRFQLGEIARLFRVPLHMLADLQNASYATVEQQGIDFATQTIRPWCVRWEREISRQIMTEVDRRACYAEFNVDGLMRGDTGSRYAAYATGRQNGWLSIDEIRERENLNPLPDGLGKSYMVPMNMTQLGTPEPTPADPAAAGVPLVATGGDDA